MMYLLDTSVFVHIVEQRWSLLSQNPIHILNDSTYEFVLSQASVYELSIKAVSYTHLDVYKRRSLDIAKSYISPRLIVQLSGLTRFPFVNTLYHKKMKFG